MVSNVSFLPWTKKVCLGVSLCVFNKFLRWSWDKAIFTVSKPASTICFSSLKKADISFSIKGKCVQPKIIVSQPESLYASSLFEITCSVLSLFLYSHLFIFLIYSCNDTLIDLYLFLYLNIVVSNIY